ncbi:MAG TPA: hypothetical protein VFM72_06430 [Aequorivita sp.]|nr:hypothetical protein [Aequorivita sp.]
MSHYLYIYALTNHFSYKKYKDKKNDSIIEWERIENNANYQTRFIAGEANFDKAVEILETKMEWVGITEEFENGLCSLKNHLELKKFHYESNVTNRSRSESDRKQEVLHDYSEFIEEKNQIDLKLYDYVKRNIWPKYKVDNFDDCNGKGKAKIIRSTNMALFQINRQLKYRTIDLNLQNIKRFYNRWYR